MTGVVSRSVGWTVRDNPDRHRLEVDLGDGVAFAEYRLKDDTIIFTHTGVPPQHGGRGVGSALIRAGLASARKRGLTVLPLCPFFAAYIRDHEEEHDLLAAEGRRQLGLDRLLK